MYRCEVGSFSESPVLRRSLRIFAKKQAKLATQHSTYTLPLQKPGNCSNSSSVQSKDPSDKKSVGEKEIVKARTVPGTKGKGKAANGSPDIAGEKRSASRKRKRASSPLVPPSSPPKKQAKKSPVAKGKGRGSNNSASVVYCTGQEAIADSSQEWAGKRHSKRKRSKEEFVAKGNCCSTDRETVIVDATFCRKNRKKDSTTDREHPKIEQTTVSLLHCTSSSETKLGRKGRSKGRSKAKSKLRRAEEERVTFPKGKTSWNSANCYSLPSLVDFARLKMASPG